MRRRARGGPSEKKREALTKGWMTSCTGHFLPRVVSFQRACTHRGRSKLEQLRSFVGWTGRGETSRYVRSPYFLDYFVPDTTKFVVLCRIIQRYARCSYEALSGKWTRCYLAGECCSLHRDPLYPRMVIGYVEYFASFYFIASRVNL